MNILIVKLLLLLIIYHECYCYKLKYHRNIVTSALVSISLLINQEVLASDKLENLPNEKIAQIVADDITIRQALITANFNRDIYSEDAKFQDEIDTYEINQYIKGTKALFNAEKSHVDLVGNVDADENAVSFKFSEKLTFNLPFSPAVSLTGRVKLTRSPINGLISYSREYWDQTVTKVLSTVSFNN